MKKIGIIVNNVTVTQRAKEIFTPPNVSNATVFKVSLCADCSLSIIDHTNVLLYLPQGPPSRGLYW